MKQLLLLLCLFLAGPVHAVQVIVGAWQPIYKGIDLADGRQQAQQTGEIEQRVLCLRIDLSDPDVQIVTSPKCTNCGGYETLAQNTSLFLQQQGLQVAVNGGFYASSSGPNDVPVGTTEDVFGLAISRGTIVSPANNTTHMVAMLLTTNKQAFFIPANAPPGTNTAGIYAAISGNLVLLLNGVNQNAPNPVDRDPRTAIGLSQDRRYLFLLTIDGRNPQNGTGWSNGADFHDTGEWLLRFGAWHGANLDGGGSTTMARADCVGNGVRLNVSSFYLQYGRERNVGHNIGVSALPLPSPLLNVDVQPGTTTALITWQTAVPSTTQVEYGPTTNYGSATPPDGRLVRQHVATLTGLQPGSSYFFRSISSDGITSESQACSMVTTSSSVNVPVFGITQAWKYTTNNLDGVNWKTLNYDDASWSGPNNGCLHIESANLATTYPPLTTWLPPGFGGIIPRTYYFRSRFAFEGATAGLTLTFSNFVDDGAAFYLNGTELTRIRLAGGASYATAASSSPCNGTPYNGDAVTLCPDLFTVSASALVQGTNVVAVEVHNTSGGTTQDLLFGCALSMNQPSVAPPRLFIVSEGGKSTLYWNGQGFMLQQSTDLSADNWSDVPGPISQSPAVVTQGTTTFYRLRN